MANLRNKLLTIGRIERQVKRVEEDRLKGFVQLPDWILTSDVSGKNYVARELEEVTIDMVNRLRGVDRVNMLTAYHDWKARQKVVDRRFINTEKGRIYRFKNPEVVKSLRKNAYFRSRNVQYIKFVKRSWKVLGVKIVPILLVCHASGFPIRTQKSVQHWRQHGRERSSINYKLAKVKS